MKGSSPEALLLPKDQVHQIYHAAPQIGAILTSTALEKERIHIYRLENFEEEWLRLSKESGLLSLTKASKGIQLQHNSSSDPYNTTFIARLYFDKYLDSEIFHTVDKNIPNVIYLRAICRIYLIDFLCGGYKLPSVCADLNEEINMSLSTLNEQLKLPVNYFNIYWWYSRFRYLLRI